MQSTRQIVAPLWLRAALLLTTKSMEMATAASELPDDWALRSASPKWVCVWRNHPETLARLRAIVMPDPWSGDRYLAWCALLHHEKHRLGLTADDADPAYLTLAERHFFRQLAAPWGDLV
ncbi:hypothetical protein ACSSV1_005869 [Labrenzia sp. MBR-25]|jgi:hypothetical protein